MKITQERGGWVCLWLWAILIVAGIMAKRMYGLAHLMVFFHLPAAVFLVLAFYLLSKDIRKNRLEELKRFTRNDDAGLWSRTEKS